MKVLIFDVETTGLLPKIINPNEIEKYPHIIQLSYILYDKEENRIEESFNEYIIISRKIKIPLIVTKLTGIKKEDCLKGVSIMTGIKRFYNAYKKADYIVAHNLEFDSKMIYVETIRNKEMILTLDSELLKLSNIMNIEREKNKYCTMKNGRGICNILKLSNDGKEYYLKWPKLIELYEKLFGETVENLHDSLVDTVACLRCYLKMSENIELSNETTKELIKNLK